MRAASYLPLALCLAAIVLPTGCRRSSSKPFRIDALIPAMGPAAGGTDVVIVGKGFKDGSTVSFGGVDSSSVTFISRVAMRAIAPPGAVGVVDLAVTTPSGRRVFLLGAFTYIAPPTLISINPSSGPVAGGTQAVITGLDFQSASTVTLGGQPVTVLSESPPTTLVAIIPPGTAGPADLTIVNLDGQTDAMAAAYTYVPPPKIVVVLPIEGPQGGLTPVTINGLDFQPGVGGTTVTFAGTDATNVSVISDTEIRCTTPPGPVGPADVDVTNPDGQADLAGGAFLYTTAYSWYERMPTTSPPFRDHPAMAHDPSRGVTVLFGGSSFLLHGDTWEWDGADWTERMPASSPIPRTLHAMVQDTVRDVTVLFGGGAGGPMGDTWEWDGIDWTEAFPVMNPPARQNHAMAFDSARGVVVLFGGFDGFTLADTWEWDGVNWTLRNPIVSPLPRLNHALSFDETRGVTVLFGGLSGPSYLSDTWEWDGTNWVQQFSPTSPPPRDAHGLAYDAGRGLTVLFGGYNATIPVGDTWEWDGIDWVQVTPGTAPADRLALGLASDTTQGTVVLFGGFDGVVQFSDTWEFAP